MWGYHKAFALECSADFAEKKEVSKKLEYCEGGVASVIGFVISCHEQRAGVCIFLIKNIAIAYK